MFRYLSSMPFAIFLLCVLAIASLVGTLLQQNAEPIEYLNRFGPFWSSVFNALGLFDTYHSWWFIAILAFLVLSTSLCIVRRSPGIIREIKNFRHRSNIRSLRLLTHQTHIAPHVAKSDLELFLTKQGFRLKSKENLILARKGAWGRLGYILAHGGIVLLCLGGLLDANLWLKFEELMGWKKAEVRNDVPQISIPTFSRRSADALAFRANVSLNKNQSASVAFMNAGLGGYFVQELPFIMTLKKFYIEHYSNGVPKRFVSEVEVSYPQEPSRTEVIEVNRPLVLDNISIYQASFGDGGSVLQGEMHQLESGNILPIDVRSMTKDQWFDWREYRPFNIEDLTQGKKQNLEKVRAVKSWKKLTNLGPSIQATWRSPEGIAQEYVFLLQPQIHSTQLFRMQGVSVPRNEWMFDQKYLLIGLRGSTQNSFRWIDIPLDVEYSARAFFSWLSRMKKPDIVDKTVQQLIGDDVIDARSEKPFKHGLMQIWKSFNWGGFPDVFREINENPRIPEAQRQAVVKTSTRMIASMGEVAGLRGVSLPDALMAMSHLSEYKAPYIPVIHKQELRQYSTFQLTRSPGRFWVYLGAFALLVGSALMFYVPLIRVWCWLDEDEQGQRFWNVGMGKTRHEGQTKQLWTHLLKRLEQLR